MKDYKKIYDELDSLDFTDEFDKIKKSLPFNTNSKEYISELLNKHSLDKKRTQQFHNFLKELEQDKPTKEVINIFNHIFSNINTTREWQPINCFNDGYWEDVFESYKTPDNQIEAVCKKYAYLEWWVKIVDIIPYYTDDVMKLIMILRLPSDFETFVKNTIQLFDYYHKTIIPKKVLSELSNTPNQEPQTPILPTLPPELSTPQVMEIWKKAQGAGLVDEQYKWLETKVLLACFAKEMSDRFNLGKGTNSDGSKRINWKIFEKLFGTSKLRNAMNDLKKTGDNPLNINLVNDIFK